MKIIISETQYNRIFEYIDPIYFLKKKFTKEPKSVKLSDYEMYEKDFQKIADIVFKLTQKSEKLEHLNGVEVVKVTQLAGHWVVLLKPIIDDWFNFKKNQSYMEKLSKFIETYKKYAEMGGIESPLENPRFAKKIEFHFWLN